MKKAALYILLLSYTTVMLKPVAPYISDLAAHVFYNSKHMSTVHYENGKLHVHKEIVDNAKKAEPAKETPLSKKDNSANDHISFFKNDVQQEEPACITHIIARSSSLPCKDPSADHPPPRIS
jgi:hypothetical protein